jgi:ketosteroid isomerase-like protein
MESEKSQATDEALIRRRVEEWAEAIRAKDVDKVISCYAPEIVSFNLAPPLRERLGTDAYRRFYEEWFGSFEGPIAYEVHELEVAVGGDVGFIHSLNRLAGKKKTGEDNDMWVRVTAGLRRVDGEWRVTHEHVSVPLRMDGSFKAAIHLKP